MDSAFLKLFYKSIKKSTKKYHEKFIRNVQNIVDVTIKIIMRKLFEVKYYVKCDLNCLSLTLRESQSMQIIFLLTFNKYNI